MGRVLEFPTGASAEPRVGELLVAFAEAVRTARVARKLSQDDVAQVVGCKQSTIARIEAGNDPHLSTAVAVARALGLDLAALFPSRARASAAPRRRTRQVANA